MTSQLSILHGFALLLREPMSDRMTDLCAIVTEHIEYVSDAFTDQKVWSVDRLREYAFKITNGHIDLKDLHDEDRTRFTGRFFTLGVVRAGQLIGEDVMDEFNQRLERLFSTPKGGN